MDRLYELADRVSRGATWFSGGLLLLSALLISVDVFGRKIFGVSMGGSDEIGGYVLAISTSWGLSFALIRRANIRIDALYSRLAPPVTAWLDLVALVLMGLFMSFVTWFSAQLWLSSVDMGSTANTPLQTPLLIPQGLWVAGFLVFLLVLAVLLARVIILLARGDHAGVRAVAGIRTVDEEVQDEVSAEIGQNLRKTGTFHAE
jgi:TRAP-type C4-dicarboxylate transport system permease small subunit